MSLRIVNYSPNTNIAMEFPFRPFSVAAFPICAFSLAQGVYAWGNENQISFPFPFQPPSGGASWLTPNQSANHRPLKGAEKEKKLQL